MFKLLKESILDNELSYATSLMNLMNKYPDVIAFDADLVEASRTSNVQKEFSERFTNCGIQEANMLGLAAGINIVGNVGYIHSFAPFVSRRIFDQIFISGAYNKLHLNICGSDGGFLSSINGGTHTSYEDLGMMRMIPGINIIEPSDGVMLNWALEEGYKQKSLNYIRVYRKPVRQIYSEDSTFILGRGNLLNSGENVLIVASGQIVPESLDAVLELKSEGINVSLIDMFSLKPFDDNLIIEHVKNNNIKLIISAENHHINNGLGSAVAEVIAENSLNVKLIRIGCLDRFGQVGDIDFLKKEYQLDKEHIIKVIKNNL